MCLFGSTKYLSMCTHQAHMTSFLRIYELDFCYFFCIYVQYNLECAWCVQILFLSFSMLKSEYVAIFDNNIICLTLVPRKNRKCEHLWQKFLFETENSVKSLDFQKYPNFWIWEVITMCLMCSNTLYWILWVIYTQ